MAVDVKPQERSQTPDLRAYLRSAAEQELTNLRNMRAKSESQLTQSPTSASGATSEESPLSGSYRISQQFGNYNPGLYAGRTAGAKHYGLDVATPEGTQVRSPFTGIVKAGVSKDFGNYVEVRTKDGKLMRFSHLSSIDDLARQLGQAGREIQAGQPLGLTGSSGYSTGPHLDIMYQQGGQWTNPLNYEPLKRSLG